MAKVYIIVKEEVMLSGRHDFSDVKASLDIVKLEEELKKMTDETMTLRGFDWDMETHLPLGIFDEKSEDAYFIKEMELL